MPDITPTDIRLQLLAAGYQPIPNVFKVPALKGWNRPDYISRELKKYGTPEEVVRSWERRFPDAPTTGVRLADGLGMTDADLDDETAIGVFWAAVDAVAPELGRLAPVRFGKGHKVALPFRVEGAPFGRVPSRQYNGMCLEIFGGEAKANGDCVRQFGVYGPHSEGTNYVFGEGVGALAERGLDSLPGMARALASTLVDAFDAGMVAAGFVADEHFDESAGGATQAYDITDETRFALEGGGTATYEDLDGLVGRRCAANFIPGEDGHNRSRCWIYWSPRHDCVGVYDHATCVSHYPAEKADVEPAAFAERLAAVVGMHGAEMAPGLPNWRERTAGGAHPRASLHNARLAIGALGFVCSLDVFHNKMLLGSTLARLPPFCGEVSDGAVMALRVALSDAFGLDFTEKHVRDAVIALAGENRFNPVTDMLAEAETNWDGVARLDRMAVEHFNAADTRLNAQCVAKTLIAAVARARRPGCKFDHITVLEAPEGWNKSSAWLVLAGAENFSDESIIGKASREVQEQLAGVWIHENAELAGMRKAEVETVKAFASRMADRARPAYGHFLVEQPRHSIEVGTTNGTEYLQSQTGNRRFWPIRVEAPIDLGALRSVRLQLWGEAAARQSGGEALTLDPELWAAAGAEQEERRVRDAWEDDLAEGLKVVTTNPGPLAGVAHVVGIVQLVGDEERVSVKSIFETIIGLPAHALDDRHTKRLANCMRALGWMRGQFRIGGTVTRGYWRKVRGN